MKNIQQKAGIYRITNVVNKKCYIGSSNNCKRRTNEHYRLLKNDKHYNRKLQFAFNKYKESNFEIDVIEYIDDVNLLLEREQFYLDSLLFANENDEKFKELGYNLNNKAERGNSFEITEEMLIKMSERVKGEKNPMFGIKMSEEMKKQISNTLSDKYSGVNSLIYKGGYIKPKNKLELKVNEYINESNIVKTRQAEKSGKVIIQYDNEMNILNEWISIKSASDVLNISRCSIKSCCDGKTRHAGFFIWRFKGQENIEYKFRNNQIIQLNGDKEIIKQYDQIVIAAEELKINRKGISKALKTGKTYCGFYWKYK